MALKDFIKENLHADGMMNIGFAIPDIAAADNKLQAVAKSLWDIATWKWTFPVTILGMANGLRTAMRSLATDTGAAQSAMERLSKIRVYGDQFQTITGSAEGARSKIAELMRFERGSQFGLGDIVGASRALQVFGNGALSAASDLKRTENIARMSGSSISDAGDAYGQFYRILKNGGSVQEAAAGLEKMGVLTEDTVRGMDRMQQGGVGYSQIFAAANASIDEASKGLGDFSKTTEGLQKKLGEVHDQMASAFGKPFLDAENKGMEISIRTAQNLVPVMHALGTAFSRAAEPLHIGARIKEAASAFPGLSTMASIGGNMAGSAVVGGASMAAAGVIKVIPSALATGVFIARTYGAKGVAYAQGGLGTLAEYATKAAGTASVSMQPVRSMVWETIGVAAAKASTATVTLERGARLAGVAFAKLGAAIFTPFNMVVGVVTVAKAAMDSYADKLDRDVDRTLALVNANRALEASIKGLVNNSRTQEDAYAAQTVITDKLADARERLAKAKANNQGPLDDQEALFGVHYDERNTEEIEAQHTVSALERGNQRAAQAAKALPTRIEQSLAIKETERDAKLKEINLQNAVDNSEGETKIANIKKLNAYHADLGIQGRLYAMDERKLYQVNSEIKESRAKGWKTEDIIQPVAPPGSGATGKEWNAYRDFVDKIFKRKPGERTYTEDLQSGVRILEGGNYAIERPMTKDEEDKEEAKRTTAARLATLKDAKSKLGKAQFRVDSLDAKIANPENANNEGLHKKREQADADRQEAQKQTDESSGHYLAAQEGENELTRVIFNTKLEGMSVGSALKIAKMRGGEFERQRAHLEERKREAEAEVKAIEAEKDKNGNVHYPELLNRKQVETETIGQEQHDLGVHQRMTGIGQQAAYKQAALTSRGIAREEQENQIAAIKAAEELEEAKKTGGTREITEAQTAVTSAGSEKKQIAHRATLTDIGLQAEAEKAPLTSRGITRTREESAIEQRAAQKELAESAIGGDAREKEAATNKLKAIETQIAMANEAAEKQKHFDQEHIALLKSGIAIEREMAAGRFASAAAMNKEMIERSDKLAREQTIWEKIQGGFTQEEAGKFADTEQSERDTQRKATADSYRSSKGFDMEEKQARADRNQPLLRTLRDARKVRGLEAEATTALGVDAKPGEARQMALKEFSLDLQARRNETVGAVSSLAAIGGGGGVEQINTSGLDIQRRQVDLLSRIAANTEMLNEPDNSGRMQ